jgi:hypothetical protein
MQKEILSTILEFKFDYLENTEKARTQETEDPIDIREEFGSIHSENLLIIKRVMSDGHLEVVHPLMMIQEGIERNLKETQEATKSAVKKYGKLKSNWKKRKRRNAKQLQHW